MMAEISCSKKLDGILHRAHTWGSSHDPSQQNTCSGFGPLKTELTTEAAARMGQQLIVIFNAMRPSFTALMQALNAIVVQFQKDIEEASLIPECKLCDTDSHKCPGCGTPTNHMYTVCDNCKDIP